MDFTEITQGVVGLDIETASRIVNKEQTSDPYIDRILSVSLATKDQEWFIDHDFERLIPLLQNKDIRKIVHNAAFDAKFLYHNLGVMMTNIWDSMLTEQVLWMGDPSMRVGLNAVLNRRFGVFLNKDVRRSFIDHTGDFTTEQKEYALEDVRYLVRLYEEQMTDVGKYGLGAVVGLENRVVPGTARMEYEGVGFNVDLWYQYVDQIRDELEQIEHNIATILGRGTYRLFSDRLRVDFNLNSGPQVMRELVRVGIETDSVAKGVLQNLRNVHPVIPQLQRYNRWVKMLGWDYPRYVHPVTGRVHPDWRQIGADTGRWSCRKPNAQQVLSADEGEPNFRLLWEPREGYVFITADYSQQEPRALAQFSQDPEYIKVCQQKDVYMGIAERLGKTRSESKTIFLALTYGSSPASLAERFGVPEKEISDIINAFYREYPHNKAYVDRQRRKIRYEHEVRTLLGRRRLIPDFDSIAEYHLNNIAVNMPIQGTAADMCKMAYASLIEETPIKYVPILVHDELLCEVPEDEGEHYLEIIPALMQREGEKLCPDVVMPVDAHLAKVWKK